MDLRVRGDCAPYVWSIQAPIYHLISSSGSRKARIYTHSYVYGSLLFGGPLRWFCGNSESRRYVEYTRIPTVRVRY